MSHQMSHYLFSVNYNLLNDDVVVILFSTDLVYIRELLEPSLMDRVLILNVHIWLLKFDSSISPLRHWLKVGINTWVQNRHNASASSNDMSLPSPRSRSTFPMFSPHFFGICPQSETNIDEQSSSFWIVLRSSGRAQWCYQYWILITDIEYWILNVQY